MNSSESILQMTVVAMIRTLYPSLVLNLSLNGISLEGLSPKQKSQLIMQAKREGMTPGTVDLLIYLPEAKVLNLEFKRPDGKGVQSDDQVAVQQQLTNLGHNYYLVSSIDQVFAAIAEHTTEAFRKSEYLALSIPLTDAILTEPFLHWPAGTTWHTIAEQLEQLYHI